jgi:hypothetical protein
MPIMEINGDPALADPDRPFTEEDARYGAAWKVCFERMLPDKCVTPTLYAEAARLKDRILSWALEQAPEVRAAYEKAAPEIEKRARHRLMDARRGHMLSLAQATLPVPPTDL